MPCEGMVSQASTTFFSAADETPTLSLEGLLLTILFEKPQNLFFGYEVGTATSRSLLCPQPPALHGLLDIKGRDGPAKPISEQLGRLLRR